MPHEQGSNVNTNGYTKAVDLWSLGCVTVVLLTGGYPFFDPRSGEYSEKLASTCNLEALEKSQVWLDVGARPKAFVRRLLVLDERLRMTAAESLKHEWFTNDAHRTDFEELYQRAIRHWRPRMPKEPVIELIEAHNLKTLPFLQGISPNSPKSRRRGPLPIDPPYKPFPRRLHNQAFFPKRRTSLFNNTMSDDVKAAIDSNWNFDKSHSTGSSVAEAERPTTCALEVGKENDNSSDSELQDKSSLVSPTSLPSLSRKPRFQPLRPKFSSKSADTTKATENDGSEAKSEGHDTECAKSGEKAMSSVRNAYSPTAGEKETGTMSFTMKSTAKLKLPAGPVTPRPAKALNDGNNGTDLSLPPWNNVRMLQSSRYFAEQGSHEAARQLSQPSISVVEGASLSHRDSIRQAGESRRSDQQKHTDQLIRSVSEAIQNETILNSDPGEHAECSHSFPGAARAVSDDEHASISAVGLEVATTGLRLKSPTLAIGDVLGIRSSNIKKRRNHSIFELEEDATGSAPGKSKKAKFDQENVKWNGEPTSINPPFPQTKPKPERAGSTNIGVEKILGQVNHTDDLYLPRI